MKEIKKFKTDLITSFILLLRGGGAKGGGLLSPFSKFKEKYPDFGKKCPN